MDIPEKISDFQGIDETARTSFQALLLNTIGEAVIATDISGKILFWNPAAEIIYGWKSSEVLGLNILDVTPSTSTLEEAKAIMEALKKDRRWSGEFQVKHRDGHFFYVNVTDTCLVENDGTPSVIVGISIDLTERKRLENDKLRLQDELIKHATEAAKSAQKHAEDISNMKSQFIAQFSHEIRTPITIIRGYAELVGKKMSDGEIKKWIDVIIRSSRQLELMISDILDISKIEAGNFDLIFSRVKLDDFLEDFRLQFEFKAKEHGISLFLTKVSPLPDYVVTAPLRLNQILGNLVSNSIKFTDRGTIEVKVIFFRDRETRSEKLAFEVTDSGMGIDSKDQKRIFEPFQQGDAASKLKYGGVGLGLYISSQLARLLGGELVLSRSELNKGSTFILTIDPVGTGLKFEELNDLTVPEPSSASEDTAQDDHCLKGIKIILAEDADDIRVLISFILSSKGAHVTAVGNGEEAVKAAHQQDVDIIITDKEMPVMDGFEELKKLRADGIKAPVILLTAHAMIGSEEASQQAGFDGYISKPIDFEKLIKMTCALFKMHNNNQANTLKIPDP